MTAFDKITGLTNCSKKPNSPIASVNWSAIIAIMGVYSCRFPTCQTRPFFCLTCAYGTSAPRLTVDNSSFASSSSAFCCHLLWLPFRMFAFPSGKFIKFKLLNKANDQRTRQLNRSAVRTNTIILLVIVSFFSAWLLNHGLNLYMIAVDPINWPLGLFSLAPISMVILVAGILYSISNQLLRFWPHPPSWSIQLFTAPRVKTYKNWRDTCGWSTMPDCAVGRAQTSQKCHPNQSLTFHCLIRFDKKVKKEFILWIISIPLVEFVNFTVWAR